MSRLTLNNCVRHINDAPKDRMILSFAISKEGRFTTPLPTVWDRGNEMWLCCFRTGDERFVQLMYETYPTHFMDINKIITSSSCFKLNKEKK